MKKNNSIDSLTEQLNTMYKNDSTLDYLKKFEEDRKALLGLDLITSSWQEPTIQEKILEMEKAIGSKTIQNAFKSHADYELYANPILSSIHNNNYSSLQEEMKNATEQWLNNDYMQTMKATNLLNDSIEKAKAIGLTNHMDSYTSKLSESISEYVNNNKLNAAQSILGLTSAMDTDIFQKEMESINNTKLITDKEIEKTKKFTIKQPNYQNEILDLPTFQAPKYKDTIMGKADKQVEILERISSYMIKQTKTLELQNEIVAEQIKETSKTSLIALIAAIASILISSIITVYVFQEEDKSDIQNHKEVTELLKANNNTNVFMELVSQLKEQNKNTLITNEELNQQNQYYKQLLKAKK
jgi:hypothetical protein